VIPGFRLIPTLAVHFRQVPLNLRQPRVDVDGFEQCLFRGCFVTDCLLALGHQESLHSVSPELANLLQRLDGVVVPLLLILHVRLQE